MEDEKIIALYWERNEDAIQETSRAYGSRLHVLANKILNNREDSQECVNDTYWKTWELIPPRRPPFFYGFLAAICRHLSFHRLDWRLAAKRNVPVVSLSQELETCIPDTRREQEMTSMEIGQAVDAFLESLPQETRMIFMRRYWHADSIKEIALRYGMTESKVKMQLSRTREKLRDFLKEEEIYL